MHFQGKGTAAINSISVPFFCLEVGTAHENVLPVPMACFKMGTAQEDKLLCAHSLL